MYLSAMVLLRQFPGSPANARWITLSAHLPRAGERCPASSSTSSSTHDSPTHLSFSRCKHSLKLLAVHTSGHPSVSLIRLFFHDCDYFIFSTFFFSLSFLFLFFLSLFLTMFFFHSPPLPHNQHVRLSAPPSPRLIGLFPPI